MRARPPVARRRDHARSSEPVSDILAAAYPWTKVLHIVSVVAWMAGLLYLPRLFVYHAERAAHGGDLAEIFTVMERKLFRGIMNPAMSAT